MALRRGELRGFINFAARGVGIDRYNLDNEGGTKVSMDKRTYTMRDIARIADVSVATVSAVVNDKGIVSPRLAARVQQAIAAVGFRPHRVARGLRSGRTHLLGMVIQDVTNPFFAEVMRGVEDTALRHGYQLMVCNSNDTSGTEKMHLDALQDQRVDG